MPPRNIDSGRIIRWGKNNRFWIKRFEGGYVFGDFVSGLNTHAFDRAENEYTKAELKKVRERMKKAQQEAEIEQKNIQEHASLRAENIWNNACEVAEHPYLLRKKVLSHGLKNYKECLVIPLKDVDGKLWSLQFINENSEKRFLSGGKKKGCYFLIGTLAENAFICEGYATGATVYECTGEPVVVAFDSGNLKSVVEAIHEKYPKLKIAICADNDCYDNANIGLEKAKEAALIANARVIVPQFKNVFSKPTDFNDLFVLERKDAVSTLLKDAFKDHSANVPEGFALSDDGLFCFDRYTNQLVRISNYIKTLSFTKNNGEIGRLIEFRDYRNNLQRTLIKPKMFTKDGDQIRVHLISKGFVFSGNALSKRKLYEYIASSIPEKEATLISKTGFSKMFMSDLTV